VLLTLLPGVAFAQENKEYMIKAAFIYNFVKFIEWPGDKAIAKQSSIDICVVGGGPMGSTAPIFKQASTSKLALNLMEEESAKSASTHCHVVFLSADADSGALAELKGKPILTVSDKEGFAESGGMVGFVLADSKIRFEVNMQAVQASQMRVDAQLLEIALKVIGK